MKRLMILRVLLCTAALLALAGCVPGGVTARFPKPLPPAESAEVTVILDRSTGALFPRAVMLDGWTVAGLGPGERITFHLPPGTYSIGTQAGAMSLRFDAGTRNFFVLSTFGFGVRTMNRLTAEEAVPWLVSTADVSGIALSPEIFMQ